MEDQLVEVALAPDGDVLAGVDHLVPVLAHIDGEDVRGRLRVDFLQPLDMRWRHRPDPALEAGGVPHQDGHVAGARDHRLLVAVRHGHVQGEVAGDGAQQVLGLAGVDSGVHLHQVLQLDRRLSVLVFDSVRVEGDAVFEPENLRLRVARGLAGDLEALAGLFVEILLVPAGLRAQHRGRHVRQLPVLQVRELGGV